MSFDRGVLGFLAVFVLLGGVGSLVSPESLAEQAGWSATPAGLTEIRAFYGGVQIGLGCFLAWCVRTRKWTLPGLFVAGFAVGGIGLARAIGLLVDQEATTYHLVNLAIEFATVVLVAVAVSRHRQHGGE